jgi:ribonucleoside-diphosphate reductase alpha chain
LNPLLEEVAREEGFYSAGLVEYIKKGGDIKKRTDVPEDFKELFGTSFDIPAKVHVEVQAAFQRHTDNAVSKTINLPPASTVEDVKEAYLLAYGLGCKGITVYRHGTRPEQVLSCKDTLYC